MADRGLHPFSLVLACPATPHANPGVDAGASDGRAGVLIGGRGDERCRFVTTSIPITSVSTRLRHSLATAVTRPLHCHRLASHRPGTVLQFFSCRLRHRALRWSRHQKARSPFPLMVSPILRWQDCMVRLEMKRPALLPQRLLLLLDGRELWICPSAYHHPSDGNICKSRAPLGYFYRTNAEGPLLLP
jgi:hypothetical protein